MSDWVDKRVAAMFRGRSGHGGSPCTTRVLDKEMLWEELQKAYDAGMIANARTEPPEFMKKQFGDSLVERAVMICDHIPIEDWPKRQTPHAWENHIPEEVREVWNLLSAESRMLLLLLADNLADMEEYE